MTWVQVGVGVASIVVALAGIAVAAWFGFWTMADRRFAEWRGDNRELRGAIDKTRTELRETIDNAIDKTRTELREAIDNAIDKTRTELREAIDRSNENNDKAHGELRGAIDSANTDIKRLDASVNDVKVTVTGIQKDVQYLGRDHDRLASQRDGGDSEEHRP